MFFLKTLILKRVMQTGLWKKISAKDNSSKSRCLGMAGRRQENFEKLPISWPPCWLCEGLLLSPLEQAFSGSHPTVPCSWALCLVAWSVIAWNSISKLFQLKHLKIKHMLEKCKYFHFEKLKERTPVFEVKMYRFNAKSFGH